jgi:large subunit ribosomal protein L18e
MKSKNLIEKQIKVKNNSILVETIRLAKNHKNWFRVAEILSRPRRSSFEINLSELDKLAKEGETIVVPGKILSAGELNKKIKIVAVKFSEKAKEKILKSKGEIIFMNDEIKKNPDAKGVRILE